MTIKERIKAVQDEIDAEMAATGAGVSQKALMLQEKAAAAILGGRDQLMEYMAIFTTDPDELSKLTPDDSQPPHVGKNLAIAYLVGNGPCGPESPGGPTLMFGVEGALDEVAEEEDGEEDGGGEDV